MVDNYIEIILLYIMVHASNSKQDNSIQLRTNNITEYDGARV